MQLFDINHCLVVLTQASMPGGKVNILILFLPVSSSSRKPYSKLVSAYAVKSNSVPQAVLIPQIKCFCDEGRE